MTIEKTAEELGITEYERWCHDLAEYACTWIVKCQNKIVEHAREIFSNLCARWYRHMQGLRKMRISRSAGNS